MMPDSILIAAALWCYVMGAVTLLLLLVEYNDGDSFRAWKVCLGALFWPVSVPIVLLIAISAWLRDLVRNRQAKL